MRLRIFGTRCFVTIFSVLFLVVDGWSGDLNWTGRYRFEGVQIGNSELNKDNSEKSYFLHHLVLGPKIIAGDGIEIIGRFDLFNNDQYPNSQLGQVLGNGPGEATPTDSTNSNVLSRVQKSETIQITELYFHWINEYGALIAGRVPIQFGLGMTYSAGRGDFDHWLTTKDLVGYKISVGNILLVPMYGKVDEGSLGSNDDVNDYMFHFQYDNPDSELSLGLFYETRISYLDSHDPPTSGSALGGANSVKGIESFNAQILSLFVAKRSTIFGFSMEAAFTTGRTGVATQSGSSVDFKGTGVATETYWKPSGNWNFKLVAGMASGDNPNTDESFEGFLFNRNYNIGLMLFNHRMGQYDIFRTSLDQIKNKSASDDVDSETISNAMYFAPSAEWKWTEKLSLNSRLIYAVLSEKPNSETASDLGLEFDFGTEYRPFERLSWITEVGVLFPGGAFRGGTLDLPNDKAFALSTKATISF